MLFGQNPRTKRFKRTLIIIYLDKDWTTQRNNQLGFCERVPEQAWVTSVIWTRIGQHNDRTISGLERGCRNKHEPVLFGQGLDNTTMEPFQGFRDSACNALGDLYYLDEIMNSAPLRTGSSVQVQPVRSPAQRWRISVLFEGGLDHEKTRFNPVSRRRPSG